MARRGDAMAFLDIHAGWTTFERVLILVYVAVSDDA